MSIKTIVGRGFSFGSGIPDTVRSGWIEGPVPPAALIPKLIRVFRASDLANYAKVGEDIVLQGIRLLCPNTLADSETPGNIFVDSETPGNIFVNSEGIN